MEQKEIPLQASNEFMTSIEIAQYFFLCFKDYGITNDSIFAGMVLGFGSYLRKSRNDTANFVSNIDSFFKALDMELNKDVVNAIITNVSNNAEILGKELSVKIQEYFDKENKPEFVYMKPGHYKKEG